LPSDDGFKAKMHQIRFRLGLCPRPHWETYSAPPASLAGFGGLFAEGEGLGWERGGKGEGWEWRGGKERAPKLLLNQGPSEPCYATAWVTLRVGTWAHFFLADLCMYARTVWFRATKFGMLTHVERGVFLEGQVRFLSQRSGPPATFYMRPHCMTNCHQISHGDQTSWQENFLRSTTPCQFFVTWMLTHDLFAVARLFAT